MQRTALGLGLLVAAALVGGAVWARRAPASDAKVREAPGASAGTSRSAGGRGTPVVLELFSSEGCSSCPPADEYLRSLDGAQPIDGARIVALEYHVDYWDHIGWKDPFAEAAFGARQRAYASALGERTVYTPELVLDGGLAVSARGSSSVEARIHRRAAEPHARVEVVLEGDAVRVRVSDVPAPKDAGDSAEVWLAVTESGLTSRVTDGENDGRTLVHAPIVRRLSRLGEVAQRGFAGRASLAPERAWKREALRAVAFVQERRSRRIVGAGGS